jgi:hypothetical protein
MDPVRGVEAGADRVDPDRRMCGIVRDDVDEAGKEPTGLGMEDGTEREALAVGEGDRMAAEIGRQPGQVEVVRVVDADCRDNERRSPAVRDTEQIVILRGCAERNSAEIITTVWCQCRSRGRAAGLFQ